MEIVRLGSDGIIEGVLKGTEIGVLPYLSRQVELASDFTLRSFFRMLEAYDALVHLNDFFPTLLKQYRQSPASGCQIGGIDRLVLEKTVEMIGFPGEPRLEIYRRFTGMTKETPVPIKDYQVDMLLDLTVCLGKLRHVIFGDSVDVFEFDTVYTFFEFVEGIGWELGFHGTPRECQLRR